MDPEDKDYVCSLDEYSLEKAKKELFEDPKQRLGAVQSLRTWIKSQPQLTSRTDTQYLLQVLRTAKFSQLRAREITQTILTLKTKHPEYLLNLDTHDPGIKAFLDIGAAVLLPKTDSEGRSIVLRRPGVVDASNPLHTVQNEVRSILSVLEFLRDNNEKVIVNGVTIVIDMTGVSAKLLTRFRGDAAKTTTKIFQEGNTGRMKSFDMYNAGAILELVMGILKPLMKKKFSDRIFVHDNMESMYKILPMELWPDEFLPDDYTGPSAGPLKTIIDTMRDRMMEPGFRSRLLEYSSDTYRIDEKKTDNAVPQESFRSLNMD